VNVAGSVCNPVGALAKARDAGIGPSLSGLWFSHWCKAADGKYGLNIGVVASSDVASFPGMAHDWMVAINGGSDYDAVMAAYRDKYAAQTGDPYAPKFKAIWYPSLAAIMAAKPADETPPVVTPPVAAYVVQSNGSLGGVPRATRPAYPFASGVRSTVQKGTALVGQPCFPDVALSAETGGKYMAYGPAQAATSVALCALK
jgi:hypothetical protein